MRTPTFALLLALLVAPLSLAQSTDFGSLLTSAESAGASLASALETGGTSALSSYESLATADESSALSAVSSYESAHPSQFASLTSEVGGLTATGASSTPTPTGGASRKDAAGLWVAGAAGAGVLGLAALL